MKHESKGQSWDTIDTHYNNPPPLISKCLGWNAIIIIWREKSSVKLVLRSKTSKSPSEKRFLHLETWIQGAIVTSYWSCNQYPSSTNIQVSWMKCYHHYLARKKQHEAHTSQQDFQVADTAGIFASWNNNILQELCSRLTKGSHQKVKSPAYSLTCKPKVETV